MTGALFDLDAPEPDEAPTGVLGPPPNGLGHDALKTWRQRALIAQGIHPVTRAPLTTGEGRCGDCQFLYLTVDVLPGVLSGHFTGSFWKCGLAASKTNHGPDIRKWWPGCQSHRPEDTA